MTTAITVNQRTATAHADEDARHHGAGRLDVDDSARNGAGEAVDRTDDRVGAERADDAECPTARATYERPRGEEGEGGGGRDRGDDDEPLDERPLVVGRRHDVQAEERARDDDDPEAGRIGACEMAAEVHASSRGTPMASM